MGVKTIGNNEIFNNTENIASGYNNHVEGLQNEAYGHFIHNEGYKNKAQGYYHHIEGAENNRSQILQDVAGTHVEGTGNNAYGNYSHIEGMYNATYDSYSHVNGESNDSDGIASTVIGSYNLSSRENKRDRYTIAKEHPEKNFTTLNRTCYISRYEQSPIETFEPFWGFYYPQYETLTYNDLVVGDYFLDVLQSVTYNNYVNKVYHVISIEPGVSVTAEEYTLEDKWNHKDKLFVVGNGTDWDNHSNAHTLDWDGNAWYSGDVYVGSTSGTNKDEGSKKLATEEYVAEEIANIGNTLALHPIGSIYMSVNETSPAELFGGTWEQLKNRFLLGTSDAHPLGETGGSETHTLTQAELPKLTGTAQFGGGSVGATEGGYGAVRTASGIFSGVNVMQYGRPTEATTGRYAQNTTSFRDLKIQFGSGKAHNNMPPYIAVNIWKRVA